MSEEIDKTFCNLIRQIVKKSQQYGYKTTKTHILKLSYLVELEYVRYCKTRLTKVEWVYYKYGPYVNNYDEYIDGKCISIKSKDDDFSVLNYNKYYDNEPLDRYAERLVERILKIYGNVPLNELLDYIYFNTEPMMNANHRGEILNFDSVLPLVQLKGDLSISKNELATILQSVKEQLKNASKI